MNEQLYRLVEADPEYGVYRNAIENRNGTLPDGVLVWLGPDNYLQGFLVPSRPCIHGRVEPHWVIDDEGGIRDRWECPGDRDRSAEATTEPLTADDIRAAAKALFDAPLRPDLYQDGPAMRRALGIDQKEAT